MPPEVVEELRRQEDLFRKKFGRAPGLGDPVFFDPGADKPRPLPDGFWDEAPEDLAGEAGIP